MIPANRGPEAPMDRVRLLLGGWRAVAEGAHGLARALEQTPDACACGDGRAHLAGSCDCCRARRATECLDCARLLDGLDEKIQTQVERTLRYLPALADMGLVRTSAADDALRRVPRDLGAVVRTFARLRAAVREFERGCSTGHLRAIRQLTRKLRSSVGDLERALDETG
jgi:hypothetical protein